MPRTLAKLSTFLVCGFVPHDLPTWILTRRILPPGATIAFVPFGLGAIASARLGGIAEQGYSSGPMRRTWAPQTCLSAPAEVSGHDG